MKARAALVLASGAALAAGAAGAASDPTVRADGRVGRFRIDVTTEAQLRAAEGKPDRIEKRFLPPKATPVGRTLYYGCGRGCRTAYSINFSTGRLSDFSSTSTAFATARGSRVGMSGRQAARREGRKLLVGCGDGRYIHLRWDERHQFVLVVWRGTVSSITYLGPHSVYYDGLC